MFPKTILRVALIAAFFATVVVGSFHRHAATGVESSACAICKVVRESGVSLGSAPTHAAAFHSETVQPFSAASPAFALRLRPCGRAPPAFS